MLVCLCCVIPTAQVRNTGNEWVQDAVSSSHTLDMYTCHHACHHSVTISMCTTPASPPPQATEMVWPGGGVAWRGLPRAQYGLLGLQILFYAGVGVHVSGIFCTFLPSLVFPESHPNLWWLTPGKFWCSGAPVVTVLPQSPSFCSWALLSLAVIATYSAASNLSGDGLHFAGSRC